MFNLITILSLVLIQDLDPDPVFTWRSDHDPDQLHPDPQPWFNPYTNQSNDYISWAIFLDVV